MKKSTTSFIFDMGSFNLLIKTEFGTPLVFFIPEGVYAKRVPFYIRSMDEQSLIVHNLLEEAASNNNITQDAEEAQGDENKIYIDPFIDIDLDRNIVHLTFVLDNKTCKYITLGEEFTERVSEVFSFHDFEENN